jgi:hypothetical protein
VSYYNHDSTVSGLSYGQWTVKWWQWALSIPKESNPLLDKTGTYAGQKQHKDVWFLAGIWADDDEEKIFPKRKCKVPRGRPLLIPILNCEADPIEHPEIRNDQDLLDHVSAQMHKIVKKECFVNEEHIPPQKIRSDPIIFELDLHPDFDRLHVGQRTRASADGYWVFLKPLPRGKYNIRFEGSYEYGRLSSGANYDISII